MNYKLDNLDEMDQFFGTHKLSQLTQSEINHWNNTVTIKEIKFIREGNTSNSFYECSVTLIPNPDQDRAKKEDYLPRSIMNRDAEILHKILAKRIWPYIKRTIYHDPVGLVLEM